ncbi:unnamed protein product [Closterium sp. NIES-53]
MGGVCLSRTTVDADVDGRQMRAGEAGITATGTVEATGGGPRSGGRLRIVIIGDVHGMWHRWRDLAALKLLKVMPGPVVLCLKNRVHITTALTWHCCAAHLRVTLEKSLRSVLRIKKKFTFTGVLFPSYSQRHHLVFQSPPSAIPPSLAHVPLLRHFFLPFPFIVLLQIPETVSYRIASHFVSFKSPLRSLPSPDPPVPPTCHALHCTTPHVPRSLTALPGASQTSFSLSVRACSFHPCVTCPPTFHEPSQFFLCKPLVCLSFSTLCSHARIAVATTAAGSALLVFHSSYDNLGTLERSRWQQVAGGSRWQQVAGGSRWQVAGGSRWQQVAGGSRWQVAAGSSGEGYDGRNGRSGDFGEEQVQLVQQVAAVKAMMAAVGAHVEVAVILGNHDAWFHMFRCSQVFRWFHISLHVGYGRVDLPQWHLSIVGARPFSYGPSSWAKSFYRARCGVRTMNASMAKITETIRAAPESHSVVVLAHNGPAGLGSNAWDICGKDFPSKGLPPGGDFGDEDLSRAITASLEDGRHIPLVVFGHMHRDLFPFNYRSRSNRPSTLHTAPTWQGEAVTQRRMAAVLLHPHSPPLPSSAASPPAAATPPAAQPAIAAPATLAMSAAGTTTHAPSTNYASTHGSTYASNQASSHTVFLNSAVVPRIVSLDEEHFTQTSGPGLAVYPALGSEPLDATPGLFLPYLKGVEGRGGGGSEGIARGVCRGMEGLRMGDARDGKGEGEAQVPVQTGCMTDDTSLAEMLLQRVVASVRGDDGERRGEGHVVGEGCGEMCGGDGGAERRKSAEAVVWENEVRWDGMDGVAVGEVMGERDAGVAPSLHHFVLAHLAVQGALEQGQVGLGQVGQGQAGQGPVGQEPVLPSLGDSVVAAAGDGGREGQCLGGGEGRWVCVGAEDVWVKVDERTSGGGSRGVVACLHRKDRR